MYISRKGENKLKIYIDTQEVEQVKPFKYLGSAMNADGYCNHDIESRIVMGKIAFMAKKNLLTSKLDLELRKRIVKATMWRVALYGAENWTLTQNYWMKLVAIEMWIWRNMLKISWMQKLTNQEVLDTIQEERSIVSYIHQRKHKWIGHVT